MKVDFVVLSVLLKKNHHLFLILMLFCLLLLSTACSSNEKVVSDSPVEFEVDPIFREFYSHLGGEERIGRAISGIYIDGSKTIQYLETCKLIYDSNAMPTQHFMLAPLGVEMGLREPSIPPPKDPGYRYFDGHTIFPDFEPLYEDLGAKVVGRPLTEARFNFAKNQYEQFYENFGFYRKEGEAITHLMPYGLWACGGECSPTVKQSNAIMESYHQVDPIFSEFVEKYGADFTGFAISGAFMTQDGTWQQIFENLVLVSVNINDPDSIYLLSLPEKLNLVIEPTRPYSGDPENFFYTVQETEGYEIPNYFWDYISDHGGIGMFGPPIQHVSSMNHQVTRQCFTELCLLYDPNAVEGAQIRPEPLGYSYEYLYTNNISYPTPTTDINLSEITPIPQENPETPRADERQIVLDVWEKYPMLAQNQIQEIGIMISNWDEPQPNIKAELIVEFPDQTVYSINMPPTQSDGKAFALLPPIEAPNGSLIDYKVCLQISDQDKFCIHKDFMIWDNP